MKVNGVLVAREAWGRLMKCRFRPAFAYQLANYAKLFRAELAAVEEQRMTLIRRHGEQAGPNAWSVDPKSPQFVDYVEEFQPLLDTEVELKPSKFTIKQLLIELEQFEENTIEPGDLEVLEPFFTQPKEEKEE